MLCYYNVSVFCCLLGYCEHLDIHGSEHSFPTRRSSALGPVLLTPGNFSRTGGLYFTESNTKRYEASFPDDYTFESGDLVVVMTDLSAKCEILGNPGIIDDNEIYLHNQRIGKIHFVNSSLDKGFIYHFFNSESYKKDIKSSATGTTVRHTAPKRIYSVRMAVPPISEQKRIASILTTVDDKVLFIENQIQQTEQLKKGLMEKLLTEGIGHTEFKDTKIGRIPENWGIKTLRELTKEKIVYGIVQPGPHIEKGIPFINSKDVGVDINIEMLSCTSIKINEKYSRSKVIPGDIVLSLRGNTGQTSIVPSSLTEANLSRGVARIRVKDSYFSQYIKYQLGNPIVVKRIHTVRNGTTFKEIPLEALRQIYLPCSTSILEQKQIASILSTVDDKIEILTQKKSEFQTLKKGLSQQLLIGQMRVKV